MKIEEALRLSSSGFAYSEDGSAEVFWSRGDRGVIFFQPTSLDGRRELRGLRKLEGDGMEAFLRGMKWIPDQPKDAVTLLGEVSDGDDQVVA